MREGHAHISSRTRGLNILEGLSLHLHLYFVYARNEVSGESEHMLSLEPNDQLNLNCKKVFPWSFKKIIENYKRVGNMYDMDIT